MNTPVRNVRACVAVSELLRESKVNDKEFVTVSSDAHDEIVRLDVAVYKVLTVDVLDASDHLVGQHQDGFHREAAGTEVEQVLETRTEQLHDQRVVVPRLAEPADVGYADPAL